MIWKSTLKGDDRIIAYHNSTIYKGNPKPEEVETTIHQLKSQENPPAILFGVPHSLLKEINYEEDKGHIEVLFGSDSSEHLKVGDNHKRREIFEFFKSNIPNTKNFTENYSMFKAGKKPLIAMLVILALFSWTFYIANEIQNGYEYEVVGKKGSIATIVLAIASLGIARVILIFGTLFGIAVTGFILKVRKPKVVHTIQVIR